MNWEMGLTYVLSHLHVCSVVSDSETLWMDCSLPGSAVHGIFPARIPEWVAVSSSRRSSWPRDQTHGLAGGILTMEPPGKPCLYRSVFRWDQVHSGWCGWGRPVCSYMIRVQQPPGILKKGPRSKNTINAPVPRSWFLNNISSLK